MSGLLIYELKLQVQDAIAYGCQLKERHHLRLTSEGKNQFCNHRS